MPLCLGDGEALSCVMLNKILFLPNSLGGAKISLGPKWHCLRFIQRGPSPLSCMESHPAVNYHLNRRSHVLERATPVLAFFHRDMYWGSYKVLTFLCEAVQLGCSSPRNKKKITFWQVYSLKEEKKNKVGGEVLREFDFSPSLFVSGFALMPRSPLIRRFNILKPPVFQQEERSRQTSIN